MSLPGALGYDQRTLRRWTLAFGLWTMYTRSKQTGKDLSTRFERAANEAILGTSGKDARGLPAGGFTLAATKDYGHPESFFARYL
jgi:hypothetical protein